MSFHLSRRQFITQSAAAAALPLFSWPVFAQEMVPMPSFVSGSPNSVVNVPKDPQRIAIADYAVLDTLDHWNLGQRVVAVTKANRFPDLPQYFEKNGKIRDIGTLFEIDLEALMDVEPDVIFISGRLLKKAQKLAAIAPVVYQSIDRTKGTFASYISNQQSLGKLFNKDDQAKADISHFQGRIEKIRKASQGKTALVSLVTSSHVNLLGTMARCDMISNEFGFTNITPEANSTHGREASFELLLQLNPDYFFVLDRDSAIGRPGAKLAQDILNNEIVHSMKAYQNNHIVYLSPAAWYLAEGGFGSMNRMFTDIERSLGLSA